MAAEQKPPGDARAKRAVGRPRRLDPETIVATARRIIEEEGVAALSMRRVAREVGVTPMALYHHVRDKDELLMLTLSGTAATFPRPELPADPRERLIDVSVHMHQVLEQLPWVLEILALGDLTDKGALWMVEEILASSIACGLSPEQAVRAYRTIWHFVYGNLVFTAAMARRAAEPERQWNFPTMLTDEDAAQLPRLTELASRWDKVGEYDIREQLAAIIDGLLSRAERPQPGGGSTSQPVD
ncbi:TetR/AcrR family transcriptional regulator [Streptomyces albipurpureus]|uniref:TetR/AcrR family transcriptional regulator n=1 Tax=Streptomyces albipurpureus TaxID=2897419 RepID=A0ABT0V442_9ACTN|nr:TetR/AcrR family transcriptional regulator [Streptomyces sp. CWNU-1]MCM2394151.1 TetR/AcrR family transcriptional regulator [Streptomyces sp. CWNU-1]